MTWVSTSYTLNPFLTGCLLFHWNAKYEVWVLTRYDTIAPGAFTLNDERQSEVINSDGERVEDASTGERLF